MVSLGICLSLAAGLQGGSPVFVPVTEFTLAWTHSIEKVRWEEDYAVRLDPVHGAWAAERSATCSPPCGLLLLPTQNALPPRLLGQPVLQALQARVRGSAAGMEPPPDAVLRQGWYHYAPTIANPPELRLTRSEFTPDYEVCVPGRCQPMADWMPSDGGVTLLKACRKPE